MLVQVSAIHPDGTEEDLASYELSDITSIMENEMFKDPKTTKPKVSLSFELSRSGLMQLNSAVLKADETVMEEIKVEKKKSKKTKTEKSEDDEKTKDEKADDEEKSEDTKK